MKITEFKKKLKDIRNKDFIRSKRKGPTGIGYTLEWTAPQKLDRFC